jgi:hypothetical protein
MSIKELSLFHAYIPSTLNYFSHSTIIEWRQKELSDIITNRLPGACIDQIKSSYRLNTFDLAILDGSMFTGEHDLNAIYGSTYIVLNDVLSVKNYYNYTRLLQDSAYGLLTSNPKSGCGYAIFKKH